MCVIFPFVTCRIHDSSWKPVCCKLTNPTHICFGFVILRLLMCMVVTNFCVSVCVCVLSI